MAGTNLIRYAMMIGIPIVFVALFAFNLTYLLLPVMVIYFVGFLGYSIYVAAKGQPLLVENTKLAASSKKKGPVLFRALADDVKKAMGGKKDNEQEELMKRSLYMMLVTLGVFLGGMYGTDEAANILAWTKQGWYRSWYAYAVGVAVSVVVSLIFQWKWKTLTQMTPAATPASYVVTPNGVVYDNNGMTVILKFPIYKIEDVGENCIRIEGEKSKSVALPYAVKLYTTRKEELKKILSQYVKHEEEAIEKAEEKILKK
ncbi:MAG: DUF2208 family protein [Thermoprotei archaeon]|nr:DUF2208 family protein [TACK group archaeon]